MSTSLYWSIIPKAPKEHCIGALKYDLAKKLWDTDGSYGDGHADIGEEIIPYLEGIIAGNGNGEMSQDAKKLIHAINKYGRVRVFIE